MSAAGELTRREATGFIRGGMLFLEPAECWRLFDRSIWNCCGARSIRLAADHHFFALRPAEPGENPMDPRAD